FGAPVPVAAGSASTTWSTWSLADNTTASWSAAGCDTLGTCDTTKSAAVSLTVDNATPVFTAPANFATVSGDVTLTVTTNAPKVQFYQDTGGGRIPFGAPVVASGG